MSFTETMEKKVFFRIIRWFAFLVSFIGLLGIVIAAILFIMNFRNIFPSSEVKVEFKDVQYAVQEKEAEREVITQNQNNEIAKATIKNAYTAAQAFFSDQPAGIVSLQILPSYGLIINKDVVVTVINGQINGLQITAKHGQGNKIYTANAAGDITESVSTHIPTPSLQQKVNKRTSDADSKMEALITEVVNQVPKGSTDEQRIKQQIKNIALGFSKDTRYIYLTGLADILRQAPTDLKIDYANQYTNMFRQKVTEVESKKEYQQIQTIKNFTIYAGSIFTGILIVALFGLILVLLAIERNTRKTDL